MNRIISYILFGVLSVAIIATLAFAQTTTYKGLIGSEDISQWDGVSNTFQRRSSTGSTVTLHKVGSGTYVDVAAVYGGGTNSMTALQGALSAVGTVNKVTLRLASGNWTITQAVTIPSNVTLDMTAGAIIVKGTGGSLTINGQILAPPVAITSGFTGIGTDITLGAGVVYYWQQWFGAGTGIILNVAETFGSGLTSSAAITVNMGSGSPPFVLNANAQNQKVTGLYAAKADAVPGAFIQCTLLTSGTSFTSNASATKLWLKMIGGGGGGGGVSGASNKTAAAAGGGYGTYAEKIFTVTGSTVYTYAIGAGGSGGNTAGRDGGTGGTTSFTVAAVTVTAPGGGGGTGEISGTASAYTGPAVLAAVATNADFSVRGGVGSFGHRVSGTDGWAGAGGNSMWGRGGQTTIVDGIGESATGYGAGGSGGLTSTGTSYNGGAGSQGAIWACEYQ